MTKTIVEAMRRLFTVVERFIEAIRPPVPGVRATIPIEAIKVPVVVAIGSPILVRVGAESIVAIRIIAVSVVRTRISAAYTDTVISARTATAE
jgi:hypothetical protein